MSMPASASSARNEVRGVVPKLIELSEKVLYGDVWERSALSKRDRSLITVAALTALYRSDQLKGHIERALANGVTREEISEVITHSPTVVRRIHKLFAERGVHMLDAPVSGGPRGAKSGKLAIWVGGDEEVFTRHTPVLDAMGDQATYIGPIGAGSIAKLVHNCAGYAVHTALAEVFAMGVKAGLEPLALWKAVRKGANGRQRLYDRLADSFLQGKDDPPSFALRLAHKDVSLATAVGREHGVPMRLCELTLMEMTEAMNRGWGERDSRVSMLLQNERAGVPIKVDEARVKEILEKDPPAVL